MYLLSLNSFSLSLTHFYLLSLPSTHIHFPSCWPFFFSRSHFCFFSQHNVFLSLFPQNFFFFSVTDFYFLSYIHVYFILTVNSFTFSLLKFFLTHTFTWPLPPDTLLLSLRHHDFYTHIFIFILTQFSSLTQRRGWNGRLEKIRVYPVTG